MTEATILNEYEQTLMGNKKTYKSAFLGSEEEKRHAFAVIWRYVVTDILQFTPQVAVKNFNHQIVHDLALTQTFKHIDMNYNPKQYTDWREPLSIAFPDEVRYSLKAQVEEICDRLCKIGRYACTRKEFILPKNYFVGEIGLKRIKIALKYMLDIYMSDKSKAELYNFFGSRIISKRWLISHNLWPYAKTYYQTPLDYFHNTLGNEGSELMYMNELVKEKIYTKE